MFGSKKPKAKGGANVILLDVESASVGVALAHLSSTEAPVLFAEQRINLAMPRTLHGPAIAKQIERAAKSALEHIGLVAARLRGHEKTAHKGTINKTAVFLGAPWGTPNLALGKAGFVPSMQTFFTNEINSIAPDAPISFYTNADAAVYAGNALGADETQLLVLVRGEITELLLLGTNEVLGYATLPVGARSLYRTLQTHAGLSLAEIPAALALALPYNPTHPYHESIEAAGAHIVEQLAPAIEALVHNGMPSSLVVVAEEPLGEWIARTLESDDSLEALFAPGATIRTFGAKHAARYLGGHSSTPDLHLALGALFAGAPMRAFSGV